MPGDRDHENAASVSFRQRYEKSAPVIIPTFEPEATSPGHRSCVGPRDAREEWRYGVPCRRYTIASYVANFSRLLQARALRYSLPNHHAAGNDRVVQYEASNQLRARGIWMAIVMRQTAGRRRIVDVLAEWFGERVPPSAPKCDRARDGGGAGCSSACGADRRSFSGYFA